MAKNKTTASRQETRVTRMERTSAGLCDALLDEIDGLRMGTSDPTRANAISNLAGTVIKTILAEIQVSKHIRRKGEEVPTGGLVLGSSRRKALE